MKSLRGRLLLGMVAGMVFLLAVFAVTVYTGVRRTMLQELDASLATMAQTLLNYAELRNERVRVELNEAELPELTQASRPYYFQFILPDGQELGRSRSLENRPLLPEFHGPAEKPDFQSILLPTGRPGRAIGIEFRPPAEARSRSRFRPTTHPASRPAGPASRPVAAATRPHTPGAGKAKLEGEAKKPDPTKKPRPATRPTTVTLVAALDSADLEDQLAWLRWMLGGAGGAIVLLSLAVAGLVVRQGLQPVNRLAARISDIREDDLDLRLHVDDLPSELEPVVDRLNDLLQRLDEAFLRQKGFTADVAHELRTPLAGMRSTLEVALSRARRSDDYREAMSDCLAISGRMQAMVDSLLTLARLDSGQVALRPQEVHIEEVVQDCWIHLDDKARSRGLTLEAQVPPDLAWVSDRQNLTLILGNLLDNAVEYTDTGGKIWLEAAAQDQTLVLRVANTGCTLQPEQVEHVFERMWRGDASRSGIGEHAGLGLALVRRAASSLGGSAEVAVKEGVFEITITLPRTHLHPESPA